MNKLTIAIGIVFVYSLIAVSVSIGIVVRELSKTRAGQQIVYWISEPNESEVTK